MRAGMASGEARRMGGRGHSQPCGRSDVLSRTFVGSRVETARSKKRERKKIILHRQLERATISMTRSTTVDGEARLSA